MDPNEMLAKIRAFVTRWEGSAHAQRPIDEYDDAIEAMIDLDKWITRGGCLPDAWDRRHPAPRVRRLLETHVAPNPIF